MAIDDSPAAGTSPPRIGYVRVSSPGQNFDAQRDALRQAGCGKIFATGRCFLAMRGAIHQMERELRAERAAAGRASAKARGRTGGRPRTDTAKLENARILYQNSDQTAAVICKSVGIGRRTFFAYRAEQRQNAPDE